MTTVRSVVERREQRVARGCFQLDSLAPSASERGRLPIFLTMFIPESTARSFQIDGIQYLKIRKLKLL